MMLDCVLHYTLLSFLKFFMVNFAADSFACHGLSIGHLREKVFLPKLIDLSDYEITINKPVSTAAKFILW